MGDAVISFRNSGLLLCLLPVLSDCGLYVPQKDPLVQNDIDPRNGMSRQGKIESNIIANIRCEITRGLYRAVNTGNVPWLAGWGTSISLNLTWEETSNVNPGILYTTPIGGSDVFSAGGGCPVRRIPRGTRLSPSRSRTGSFCARRC